MTDNTPSTRTGDMRICGACGSQLSDSAAFCTSCGQAVTRDEDSGTRRSATPYPRSGRPVFVQPRAAASQPTATPTHGASRARRQTVSPASRTAASGVHISSDPCGGTVIIESGVDDPGAEPALRFELALSDGSALTVALDTDEDRLVIGRESHPCSLAVPDPYVSAAHAAVSVSDGVGYVQDLGSTNGTFVNGLKVTTSQALRNEDIIRIGHTEICYRIV